MSQPVLPFSYHIYNGKQEGGDGLADGDDPLREERERVSGRRHQERRGDGQRSEQKAQPGPAAEKRRQTSRLGAGVSGQQTQTGPGGKQGQRCQQKVRESL